MERYENLNLTKLREQLKLKQIDGRTKLTTKDQMVKVLYHFDKNPNDKDSMRQLIKTILLDLNKPPNKPLPIPPKKNVPNVQPIKAEPEEEEMPIRTLPSLVKLEIPRFEYERIVKIVNTYEKSRMRSRDYAQKKHDKAREEKNTKLVDAGLVEMVKHSKKREEPLVRRMNLDEYIVNH